MSNTGLIYSEGSRRFLKPVKNAQGFLFVNLIRNGRRYNRTVANLVGEVWLDSVPDHFDTIIHLDANRDNVAMENLQWRPRWFAIRYHRQFTTSYQYQIKKPVQLIQTEEIGLIRSFSMRYGLLDADIMLNALNRNEYWVFPFGFNFRVVE